MKKTLAILLALAMMVGLFAACGNSAATAASSATESAAESVEETAEEAPAEEAPAANVAAVTVDSSFEGETTDGQTVAVTVGDPTEAMAEEYITYPLAEDVDTITMWYYIPGYQDYMDSNFSFNALPAAEEATGIHIEFTEVSDSSASTNFNLMVASGDMCDLIPVMEYYSGGLAKAYDEDIIMDIGDYIDDYMPNYAAVLDTLAESTVNATLTEGHTLAFYRIKDGTYSGNGMITRADWIQEQGWEWSGDVIGLDEFTTYLKTMKDAYDVPYSIYMYDGTVGVEAAFDTEIPALVGDGFMTTVNSAIFRYDDEVTSGWITDGYREYLEWVIEMMDEGIIPKDYLSLDTDRGVVNTMQASGSITVWQANADKMEEVVDSYGADYPGLAVCAMPRVAKDPTAQYVWNDEVALVTTNGGFSLASTCENPELVCEWQNYFWTSEGYLLANYGTEGESYHMDGETPVFDWDVPVTVTGRNAPNAEMAQQLFTMLRFCGFYVDNDMLLSTFPESAIAAVDLWTLDGSTDNRNYPSAAKTSMTTEETEEIAEVESDMLTYVDETCMKFLAGDLELNDDTWAEYVDTAMSMGLETVIDVYQSVYDSYMAGER